MRDSDISADDRLQSALLQRLLAVAPHVVLGNDKAFGYAQRGIGPLLDHLVRAVRRDDKSVWVLIVALTAAFPTAEQVRMTTRALRLAQDQQATLAFLEACFDGAARFGNLDRKIRVVSSGVVIDVDFCANHVHNTGIQRVVRQTMSRWEGTKPATLVAWTSGGGAMRQLTPLERSRVVEWDSHVETSSGGGPTDPDDYVIVVPVDSVVVLPEVPQAALCEPLAALAEHSHNRVALVGYDTIPVVSADTLESAETERFVRYLTIVKHAQRIAGISAAATREFQGFVDALPAQGLTGPEAVEVSLPVDVPNGLASVKEITAGTPLVLCVGSQEPRKNHFAILFAAERLWRDGVTFRLRFIGGGSKIYTREFDKRVRELKRSGREVEVLRGVNDAVLLSSYTEAAFSVFPSLHEGYGLPVAESIAFGKPVITTAYGSTGEIAGDGGCVVVDPRDDDELTEAMRRLLTDPEELERLRIEIDGRPQRTWDDYAAELWIDLVEPLKGRVR